jgi:hypothetical protein
MLICRKNIDLIIAGETVHQGEYFTLGTVVNNLVNERGWIIVFGTSFVYIPIIYTNTDRALFLVNRNKIGHPINQSHRIDKASFKKFFNFKLNSSSFTWMYWVKSLSNGFSIWVSINLMHNNIRINTKHLFVTPGKNVTEFLKKGFISTNLISRS